MIAVLLFVSKVLPGVPCPVLAFAATRTTRGVFFLEAAFVAMKTTPDAFCQTAAFAAATKTSLVAP